MAQTMAAIPATVPSPVPQHDDQLPVDELQLTPQSRAVFLKHAIVDPVTGEQYLGENEFVNAVVPVSEENSKILRSQYGVLFPIADPNNTGKVTIYDWAAFENLLAKPDAEYEIAFRLFDTEGKGTVLFEDFYRLYNLNKGQHSLPFDWTSEWATLYLGGKKNRHDLNYAQFSQMLRGLQGERVRQAFQHFDKDKDGYITPDDFQRILMETSRHKVSDYLLENAHTLSNISTGSKISYANVRAFQNIIREVNLLEYIIKGALSKSPDNLISRQDFLTEASQVTRFSLFTPMEADILFHFAGLGKSTARLSLSDFSRVLNDAWSPLKESMSLPSPTVHAVAPADKKVSDAVESIYNFGLGSLAGAFGAFMVYPIDLVKTRMQNQRTARVGEMLYKNSLDCAKKVIKNEGFKGLYSGVLPQLVGVAPEKAIKLTVNDLVRSKLQDKTTGEIKLGAEIVAGGSAGACQVIFTNPLEIVKIRLQVQGEVSKTMPLAPRRSALWIVQNLGLVGLYKGASACLLRDVPFSAIYFPAYNHLKKDFFGESPTHKLSVWQLLTSGAIAGMPAAYLTTPCDVIKTRLQVEARKGEQSYTTLRHCAATIYKQEGFRAFFKGGPARIFRSSPQFGFTLAGYEVLQTWFPLPGSTKYQQMMVAKEAEEMEKGNAAFSAGNMMYLRSRNALKVVLDLDEMIGVPKVPGGKAWVGLVGYKGGRME